LHDDRLEITVQPLTSRSSDLDAVVSAKVIGDAAFEAVFEAHYRRVCWYALAMLRDSLEAEEAASETFDRAYRAWTSGKGPRGPALAASLVKGVPALPGDVPFTITFMGLPGYPTAFPTLPPGALPGSEFWAPDSSMLHVTGHIEIVGSAPRLLSKGQVIDAALSSPQFASWLDEESSSTWSIINVVLQNDGPTAYMPAGPSWMIEVFRERGVPRNLAMAFIDPYTGALQMNTCESPCSR